MKIMSRDFSKTEKALIIILIIVLVGLAYYYFVDRTVRDSIASAKSEEEMLQTEIDAVEQRLLYLQNKQNSMDQLEADGNLSWMNSYNNSKAEVAFLNDILGNTANYAISFSDVTRTGDQIRRMFTLQYTTKNYKEAQDIMEKLCNGENRCLVGDVRCTVNADGEVTMNQSATFYETMVGGTVDAALPKDSAAVNQ